jgi:hypothetical protein
MMKKGKKTGRYPISPQPICFCLHLLFVGLQCLLAGIFYMVPQKLLGTTIVHHNLLLFNMFFISLNPILRSLK